MTYNVYVVEHDPLSRFVTFGMPYALAVFFEPFLNSVRRGPQLHIGVGGRDDEKISDRRKAAKIENQDVVGASFGRQLGAQFGALQSGRWARLSPGAVSRWSSGGQSR